MDVLGFGFLRIENRGYSVKPIARTIILWRTLGSIYLFSLKLSNSVYNSYLKFDQLYYGLILMSA